MITVTLTDSEQRIARYLASKRYGTNRAEQVTNHRIGPQPDDDTDLEGIGGEMAVAKALNVYPDLTIYARSGGHDLVVAGKKVDVKTTRYRTGQLVAVTTKDLHSADVYVLAVGTFPRYEVVGWAPAQELVSRDNLRDLGHGLTYAMPQSELRDLATIRGAS